MTKLLLQQWREALEAIPLGLPQAPNILVGDEITSNIVLITIALAWVLLNVARVCFGTRKKLPPAIPGGISVLGNLLQLTEKKPHRTFTTWAQKHGPIFTIKVGSITQVVINNSELAKEACPNLLRLDMKYCTSITTLPDSIGRLSRLQVLVLLGCKNLQKLPTSIGQLTRLEGLYLHGCESLEALPDSITALSALQVLAMVSCSSMSKLPPTIGIMTGLTNLRIDLATEWQGVDVGYFNALAGLMVTSCADEGITALDRSGSLSNLHQLSDFQFCFSPAMTKLPETIGLLTNLDILELFYCDELRVIPNSMGQLKLLTTLRLRRCTSLETLPDCLGALTSLQELWIVQCTSITELPASIGHLSRLRILRIEGCGELQALPNSLGQLSALESLEIMDCGSLEGLGVSRALQGLRIWGCTSISELPGSCLMVLDGNFQDPASYLYDDGFELYPVVRYLKDLGVIEANDCGFLRHQLASSET